MSHEITKRADGKFEMAYRFGTEVPWHAYETHAETFPQGATIDEIATASGMEWEVHRSPVIFREAAGERKVHTIREKEVLHRSDNGFDLGIVSTGYKEVQPREMLEFFADLYHSVGLEIGTAATMFGGKRLMVSATVGEDSILEGDHIRGNLMLTTTCDGTGCTIAKFVATRPVCWNTVSMALGEKNARGMVSVSHKSVFAADAIKKQLGLLPKSFDTFISDMRKLAKTPVSTSVAESLTASLFTTVMVDEGGEEVEDIKPRMFKGVMELFHGLAKGDDIPGVHGTAWGYLNAVTEYLDHKTAAKSVSRRIEKNLFGVIDEQKTAAREMVLEYANLPRRR